MRLSKEDYREAENCLIKYNYNCVAIMDMRADMMQLSSVQCDGMPKAPYLISDSVFNTYMKLQDNKELQRAIKQLKAVENAKQLVRAECLEIFENYYRKHKSKWETMNIIGLSERTYGRRKKDLIYTVSKELKKMA